MANTNIVSGMEKLARKWHDGQFRRGPERLPYIVHPEAVVAQLKNWGYSEKNDPVILAIAWGHDLFEDTAVPAADVLKVCGTFGAEVIFGISWLTFCRENWPEIDSAAEAKGRYIERIANCAPPAILAVKLADRFNNLRDFIKYRGGRDEKTQAYYREAEPLFENIKRLPVSLQKMVGESLAELRSSLIF